jgi:hypothetical protein
MPKMATSSKQPSPKMELSFESWLQLHNLGLVEAEVVRLQLVAPQLVLFQTFLQGGFAYR